MKVAKRTLGVLEKRILHQHSCVSGLKRVARDTDAPELNRRFSVSKIHHWPEVLLEIHDCRLPQSALSWIEPLHRHDLRRRVLDALGNTAWPKMEPTRTRDIKDNTP